MEKRFLPPSQLALARTLWSIAASQSSLASIGSLELANLGVTNLVDLPKIDRQMVNPITRLLFPNAWIWETFHHVTDIFHFSTSSMLHHQISTMQVDLCFGDIH